jgi:non-ribosomal peptide synthetase component F
VGLALPRSSDFVRAVLATQKAGAAYLPIDLDYPQERIRYVLADAAPALVLVHGPDARRLPPEVLAVDQQEPRPSSRAWTRPTSVIPTA